MRNILIFLEQHIRQTAENNEYILNIWGFFLLIKQWS